MRTTDVVIKKKKNNNNNNINNNLNKRLVMCIRKKKMYFIGIYKHYTENNLKQQPEKKEIRNSGIYNTYRRLLSHKWIDGRY